MSATATLFEKLAFTTWDAIENAYEQKILLGEDAITSINLLALKNASLPNLAIADTRTEERRKGCDFEFWIGNYSFGWYRYAIQAKKLTVSSGRYQSLHHHVAGIRQISILETYSKANNALPLYCFFNYSRIVKTSSTACPKFKDMKELGCSVTPINTTKLALRIKGARTFEWFHSRDETLPWSCLVRCPILDKHWSEKVLGMKFENAHHKELPLNLSRMLENPDESAQLVNTGMFSENVEYRPKWVGVIHTDTTNTFG